jgi:Domain of Unknown Function (DUF928)
MITRSFRWSADSWCVAIAVALALPTTTLLALPSVARYRPPSNLQRPAGRQGAATRTDCAKSNFTFAAVVPKSNYGQTTAAYPTLYWYHANHTFSWARFELFATQKQTLTLEPDPIYQTTFQLKRGTTLASLTLPASVGLSPLVTGRDYQWKVTLICSSGGPDDETASGSQRSVQGWITRVQPSAKLKSRLAKTSRRYDVYAEEGLWYDAIHDLAQQRRQQPQPVGLTQDWHTLLQETASGSMF